MLMFILCASSDLSERMYIVAIIIIYRPIDYMYQLPNIFFIGQYYLEQSTIWHHDPPGTISTREGIPSHKLVLFFGLRIYRYRMTSGSD